MFTCSWYGYIRLVRPVDGNGPPGERYSTRWRGISSQGAYAESWLVILANAGRGVPCRLRGRVLPALGVVSGSGDGWTTEEAAAGVATGAGVAAVSKGAEGYGGGMRGRIWCQDATSPSNVHKP